MNELRLALQESIQSIEQTTELFYQQKIEAGYIELQNTLSILSNTINNLYIHLADGKDIGSYGDKLVYVLREAMRAMEIKDTILLSDILQYELKEVVEQILSVL